MSNHPLSRRLAEYAPWPLRLFLGVTFMWASVDKLRDPSFLDPNATSYLGNQLASAASGSPLGGFLTTVAVPQAALFGLLVMAGELLIGIAVLLGWFTRFSALMGLLINLVFYLTITWDVQPYYFGADIVFVFAWLSLALAGPGPWSVDALLARRSAAPMPGGVAAPPAAAISRRRFNTVAASVIAAGVLGAIDIAAWPLLNGRKVGGATPGTPSPIATGTPPPTAVASIPDQSTMPVPPATETAQPLPTEPPPPTATAEVPFATPGLAPETQATLTAEPTTAPTAVPTAVPAATAAGVLLASPTDLLPDESLQFVDPRTREPGVLVRLADGYVAYNAICTHEECTVTFNRTRRLLTCPCHGSLFDPGRAGGVLRGPARRPLASIPIAVAPDGSVYLAG